MSDVERLFELIVRNLYADAPARLAQPIAVAELVRVIAPYRAVRRPLAIGTAEDYEHLMLRLVAGEGGLAIAAPPEALARFRAEVLLDHPDLHVLSHEASAAVTLSRPHVERLLAGDRGRSFAPPVPVPPPPAVPAPAAAPVEPEVPAPSEALPPGSDWEVQIPGESCAYCGGTLPNGRVVNFCPHCGQQLAELRCPRCHSQVEYGWRHCVGCGTALANP